MARREPIRLLPPTTGQADGFELGALLVYPSRGLFTLQAIRPVEVDGDTVVSLILAGDDGRTSLAVPVVKAERGAVRPLASRAIFQEALGILAERRRQSRAIWSRRALDYEAKIKTGDPILLAGVLRDLHRTGEQSHSERQIFDLALARFAAEYAAVMGIERDIAQAQILENLEHRAAATVAGL